VINPSTQHVLQHAAYHSEYSNEAQKLDQQKSAAMAAALAAESRALLQAKTAADAKAQAEAQASAAKSKAIADATGAVQAKALADKVVAEQNAAAVAANAAEKKHAAVKAAEAAADAKAAAAANARVTAANAAAQAAALAAMKTKTVVNLERNNSAPKDTVRIEVAIDSVGKEVEEPHSTWLMLPPSSTMAWVRRKLAQELNLSAVNITLQVQGRELVSSDDALSLHDLKVQDGSRIRARISTSPPPAPPAKQETSLEDSNSTATKSEEMTIQILADSSLDASDSAVRLKVQSTTPISEVLGKLSALIGASPDELDLIHNGEILSASNTVQACGITAKTLLNASKKQQNASPKPSVETDLQEVRMLTHGDLGLNGQAVVVQVPHDSTIGTLVSSVSDKVGIPSSDLRLVIDGVPLGENVPITAGISGQSRIDILLRDSSPEMASVKHEDVDSTGLVEPGASALAPVPGQVEADAAGQEEEPSRNLHKKNVEKAAEASMKVAERIASERQKKQSELDEWEQAHVEKMGKVQLEEGGAASTDSDDEVNPEGAAAEEAELETERRVGNSAAEEL